MSVLRFQAPIIRQIVDVLSAKPSLFADIAKALEHGYQKESVRSALNILVWEKMVTKLPMPHVRGQKGPAPSLYVLLQKGKDALAAGTFDTQAGILERFS